MPNLQSHDVTRALSFVAPWNWKKVKHGTAEHEVTTWLKNFYQVPFAFCFDSGRSSLYIALKALGVGPGDEVLVQAYTCAVVANAIVATGATPVYIDITERFSINKEDLKKKITPHCKVLLIQHTFGIPADIFALQAVAKEHHIKIVEDCAHVLGGKQQGQLLGTFGDIGMISFGSEKPVSCGRGGALVLQDAQLAQKIELLQQSLPYAPLGVIFKQLFTFGVFFVSKPLYGVMGIGKGILALCKKLNLITKIIEPQEKKAKNLPFYPARFPNALATVLLGQLSSLSHFNTKRLEIGKYYTKELQTTSFIPYFAAEQEEIYFLRFPLLVPQPAELLHMAKKEGILLGDWYSTPLAPQDAQAEAFYYTQGSCPIAEYLAQHSVNLPTHFTLTSAQQEKIVHLVQQYARSQN